jgi:hypothetical protein
MSIRGGPHVIAGWLFVNAALLVSGIWFMYLFVAMPTNQSIWASVVGQLQHTFSDENPQAWWFAWLAALPVICVALALAYLLNGPLTRRARLALFLISLALGIATFALNDWGLAIFVALPAIWGYRAIHAT